VISNSAAPAKDIIPTVARNSAVWLFIGILAWSPLPLGGAVAWAPGLQAVLIAFCCLLWVIGTFRKPAILPPHWHIVSVSFCLVAVPVIWGGVQILPFVPVSWAHPVWSMAADVLGAPVSGRISLAPWHTEAEVLKLASYIMAGCLVFAMAQQTECAKLIVSAIVLIGSAYALYAFALLSAGVQQVKLLYGLPAPSLLPSGPFMLHNSFATYCGLVCLLAVSRFFAEGSGMIVVGRGAPLLFRSVIQYCFGRGALQIVAALLCFAGVVASASRAGFAATLVGLMTLALVALFFVKQRKHRVWSGFAAVLAAAPLLVLAVYYGGSLGDRLGQLLATDTADALRLNLWHSAERMISDSPWLGLGIGTFEDAYPMYATQVYPYVIDKAHNDYLEFAAGAGLPAAFSMWCAITLLIFICLRGARVRRRNRYFAVSAVGASALLAVHSSVDFSLQLPAVALLYASLLGVGVAQSQSSLWAENSGQNQSTRDARKSIPNVAWHEM